MLTVAEIMTRDPLTVQRDTPLREMSRLMKVHHCRQLPVLDGEQLIGIVTDRDIRVALNSPYVVHERINDEIVLNDVTAEACMTPDPMTVSPQDSVLTAAQNVHRLKFGGLPVLENQRLVGIITISDLLAHYVELLRLSESEQH
jgi:acetoin utilization protein AcuB